MDLERLVPAGWLRFFLPSRLPLTRILGSGPAAGRGTGHGVGYRPQWG